MVCHCHAMTTQNTKKHMDALQKHVDQNEYKCGDIIRVLLDGMVYT